MAAPDPRAARSRGPGRPRSFDEDEVLDLAMQAFWARGFSAASLEDLQAETGLARQSLYRTFGSKQQLFLAALRRYEEATQALLDRLLNDADGGRAGLLALIAHWEREAQKKGSLGCLLINSLGEFPDREDAAVREALLATQERIVARIARAVQAAQRAGEVPAKAAPRTLARQLVGVAHALAGLGRFGAPPVYLRDIAAGARALLAAD